MEISEVREREGREFGEAMIVRKEEVRERS